MNTPRCPCLKHDYNRYEEHKMDFYSPSSVILQSRDARYCLFCFCRAWMILTIPQSAS